MTYTELLYENQVIAIAALALSPKPLPEALAGTQVENLCTE